ncbi:hypothetical protein NQ318_015693 [Aromia moschata]|uniref:HTH psq-type domain-containing protein n=1 Tax=Aromia moschata TaxID=1265417 RepID=A0AAV8YFW4_9CUCU|nr:hypothetical protein NQ318_015693 [Aromia moschata]
MRTYQKIPGSRPYANYTRENLERAVAAIRSGMSKKLAAQTYRIPRSTLVNRCLGRHKKSVGHPTILSKEEEQLISRTLGIVAEWGFPLTKADIKAVIKKYLDKRGIVIPILKENNPGDDMVNAFIQRNNLSVRIASNIKRSRSSVDQEDVLKFFENITPALLDSSGDHIYNYDETNITDDPGARKVIVPRNVKRVERIQNHSRTAISIMVCGSASGVLLPPMVVYKANNIYENWCNGGPPGTVYKNSTSGWFDANLFEIWFKEILLVLRTREPGKRVILVGDNLASHFAPSVVQAAQENDIYMCPFPANATHLMQPLDVSVFGPMKKKWRAILETWRKESRYPGSIPKEQFPILLNRLWLHISDTVSQNLISGFRTTGLYPCNPQEVLRKLPDAAVQEEQIGRTLDASLVELLKEHRGVAAPEKKRKRGMKIEAGQNVAAIISSEVDGSNMNNVDNINHDTTQPSTSKGNPRSQKNKAKLGVKDKENLPPRKSSRKKDDSSKCGICKCLWEKYRHPVEWIKCCQCQKWICGMCNNDSKDPYFICATCEDSSDEDAYPTNEDDEYVPD